MSFSQTTGDNLLFPSDIFPIDIHQTIPRADFRVEPRNEDVSVWIAICFGYADEAGVPHATSFIINYITDTGFDHFAPVGQPIGHFRIDPTSVEVH
jgi:hypothetical protein